MIRPDSQFVAIFRALNATGRTWRAEPSGAFWTRLDPSDRSEVGPETPLLWAWDDHGDSDDDAYHVFVADGEGTETPGSRLPTAVRYVDDPAVVAAGIAAMADVALASL